MVAAYRIIKNHNTWLAVDSVLRDIHCSAKRRSVMNGK